MKIQYVHYQIFKQGSNLLICNLQYASQLPRPRGRGASPSKMSEMNASTMNARNSEMPPPALNGKDLKRKTLAERAGEPLKKQQATALNKSSYSLGSYRQPSHTSSVASSRPSSMASSRNISGGSYTSAVSTGSRPASVQAQRSQSAMGGSKIQRPQSYQGRPLSSMDAYNAVPSSGRGQGNRTGRNPFPSTLMDCPETLEPHQGEASYDTQAISEWASSGSPVKASRNISLPTAFSALSLKEAKLGPTPTVGQTKDASATVAASEVPVNSMKHKTSVPSLAPTTPSQIPKWKASTAAHASGRSPSKSPRKPHHTPCPQYINKSTNIMAQGFPVDEKYGDFSEFMASTESTMKYQREESNSLRELLAEYKGKGLYLVYPWYGPS